MQVIGYDRRLSSYGNMTQDKRQLECFLKRKLRKYANLICIYKMQINQNIPVFLGAVRIHRRPTEIEENNETKIFVSFYE